MNVLIVFASTHGHTGRIARRIAGVLRREGHHVSVRHVDEAPEDLAPFDAVVVGGSLHIARHQADLVEWAHDHHRELGRRPNAFFSASLSAAERTPEARAAVRECIDRFVEDTEWDPDDSLAVAGCVQYSAYDPATRLAMRLKLRLGGRVDDVTRDHEFTDWAEVEEFATAFAHRLERVPLAA